MHLCAWALEQDVSNLGGTDLRIRRGFQRCFDAVVLTRYERAKGTRFGVPFTRGFPTARSLQTYSSKHSGVFGQINVTENAQRADAFRRHNAVKSDGMYSEQGSF